MLTPQDVRSVQFEKNLRGYRTEDVDHFLDKVEQQLGQDAEQMEALRKQVADLTAENETLRRNMQSYEADGDMLKSALINAQRMGENVIREANQKAEDILHRANLRGDDIIRDANELLQKASDRADEIISDDVEVPNNSFTQSMRDKLSEAVKEFDAILKPGGTIVLMGVICLVGILIAKSIAEKIAVKRSA